MRPSGSARRLTARSIARPTRSVSRHPVRCRREPEKIVDPVIHQALTEDWPLSRLDSTLRAILRAGVYEIMKRDDVPVAVIVSEYHRHSQDLLLGRRAKLVNAVYPTACRGGCVARAAAGTPRNSADRDARHNAIVLSASTVVGSAAAPIAISIGGLVGFFLLGSDKSLATAPITGFNVGVALGALPAAAIIRALGHRGGFMMGCLVTALGGAIAVEYSTARRASGCSPSGC